MRFVETCSPCTVVIGCISTGADAGLNEPDGLSPYQEPESDVVKCDAVLSVGGDNYSLDYRCLHY